MQGGSFIKYFIDNYGMVNFKRLVDGVTPTNLVTNLECLTKKPLSELELGWKNTVLYSTLI